ncbi:DBH-like monooxygenase protein 2 [Orchesella cincta]|uniref:DBH-like monooxygenase protein 2 n=1 Tax=Orchesella cincta TaxID=48709 RepID=A0A1D2MJE4_ORCCI|nr:DBH-like monooxygenase protein 2 [Orchesella cincta]
MEGISVRTFITFGFLLVCFFNWATCDYRTEENPYKHFAQVDPEGNYILEWIVNWDTRRITFNVTVATNGYIGFGLSRRGQMNGSDIVIGGVNRNGRSYFTDRHGTGNQIPEIDDIQSYILHDAWERGSRTFLSFSRPFDTCDNEQDVPITDDLLQVIWTYGETDDEIQYHFQIEGQCQSIYSIQT